MLFCWTELLPATLDELKPFHRELVEFVANQPGKRLTGYMHALATWNLTKDEFDH